MQRGKIRGRGEALPCPTMHERQPRNTTWTARADDSGRGCRCGESEHKGPRGLCSMTGIWRMYYCVHHIRSPPRGIIHRMEKGGHCPQLRKVS